MKINRHNIRNGLKSLWLYFYYLSSDSGIFHGHDKFTKFIILSGPRSGTNYLRSALNMHSRVFVFGELFRFRNSIGWDFWAFNKLPLINNIKIELAETSPEIFLKYHVFRPPPLKFSSVGFKIFYFHAKNDSRYKVWEYLIRNKDIKIIHLKRQNMLRTFLSHRRALQTENWVDVSGKSKKPPAMIINPDECKNFFNRMENWQSEHDNVFSSHPNIEILYENMVANREKEFSRVQDFLQVKKIKIKPSTFKQSKASLSDDILNFDDLENEFKGTRWESFFHE